MIAYDIRCENGHVFEGWFTDSASFEDQKNRVLIDCPYCGDNRIERIPSTFAIGKRHEKEHQTAEQFPPQLAMLRKLQKYIEKHFEDVGSGFAEEAIKIYYGEQDKRNIRGTTTEQEEKELREEGIPFLKIPLVRHDS